MATTQLSGRSLKASCEQCGAEAVFIDGDHAERRLLGMRCDCGGRFRRGSKLVSGPTPVDIYELLIEVLAAECRVEPVLNKHGFFSDEHMAAVERFRKAKAAWAKAKRTLETGVRLRAELEDKST